MASNSIEGGFSEVPDESPSNGTTDGHKANGMNGLYISTSPKNLLSDGSSRLENGTKLMIIPRRLSLQRIYSSGSLSSPSAKFRQIAEEKDEISRSVPSSTSHGFRERFHGIFSQKFDWPSLWKMAQIWLKNPFNMALLLWISCVAISGAILFLVMTGMLNAALPKETQRNAWFEVNNQILNALFTLMCLYQHPKRFHHLILLYRWKPDDISTLRKIYCKNGTYKPHEWAHMMVVILLLHLNCFAQYALCGLNLGYKRSERPAIGVGVCITVAIAAPAIAGLYSIFSPLGREYDFEVDTEAQDQMLINGSSESTHCRRMSLEKRFSFASRNERRIIEYAPVWSGGLFDIWDNIAIAYLSIFCSFCVFGWNMERLGFGNMYVHIVTFLLFCTAPFWVFNLAAINIDNETVREALGFTGIVLCIFGLLYGGFWRIQMRKRFNLPANDSCCGKPAIADCAQWLFCCWCSLAQEVRTADYYDIVEDKFCRKQTNEQSRIRLSPLARENGAFQLKSSPRRNSPRMTRFGTNASPSPSRLSNEYHSPDRQLPRLEEDLYMIDTDNFMKAPILQSVQREDDTKTYEES
ncbi:PLAC8 domain-containing protein/DUF2985 domain-containing protein [Cephalotus follicularis]|uniref:PLAC8 domain-containing protein/DUF2985 domain-containing protein n=1 Tax=Cephalotus follicularis TaxID=3775 RepID=A0A1Q3CKS9_CEPFO|nr:PLAC8 domain-containing protein/DUF2985 domain-containing protein [Cephalotus follicularis]